MKTRSQNLCFKLPSNFKVLEEKYELANDQNLQFYVNLVSDKGTVITVLKAKEDLETYDKMIRDYEKITDNLQMKKKFKINMGENQIALYIIGKENCLAQAFVQIKGELFSFLTSLEFVGKNYAETKNHDKAFQDLIELLRGLK